MGLTILGEIFACVTIFIPTIEVATFGLYGWVYSYGKYLLFNWTLQLEGEGHKEGKQEGNESAQNIKGK